MSHTLFYIQGHVSMHSRIFSSRIYVLFTYGMYVNCMYFHNRHTDSTYESTIKNQNSESQVTSNSFFQFFQKVSYFFHKNLTHQRWHVPQNKLRKQAQWNTALFYIHFIYYIRTIRNVQSVINTIILFYFIPKVLYICLFFSLSVLKN